MADFLVFAPAVVNCSQNNYLCNHGSLVIHGADCCELLSKQLPLQRAALQISDRDRCELLSKQLPLQLAEPIQIGRCAL